MGLKNTIRKAAAVGFAVVDDLTDTYTFETVADDPTALYNPQTGTKANIKTTHTIQGIRLTRPSTATDSGLAKQGDSSLLVQSSPTVRSIAVNSQVVDSDGNAWVVVAADRDPADATVEFLLRRNA